MKLSRTALASLAALTSVAAPAAAQPGMDDQAPVVVVVPAPAPAPAAAAPVAAQPAPHNEHWNNVSHINGQIVPVGERGKYLIAAPKTNISTNPIGWMFGFYGASVSHAIHENVAIRADANIFELEDQSGYEFGVSLPIYFKRAYSGPFLEPGVLVRELRSKSTTCNFDCDTESVAGPSMMFGWHWTFDSGLNVAMAGGLARKLKQRDMSTDDYGDEDVVPAGYFRVGYAF
jgi:hypothetical protein